MTRPFITGIKDFFEGVTADVSNSGACIHTDVAFEEGIEILIQSKAFGNVTRKATVKWCEKINKDIYRIGLAFSRHNS